MASCLINSVRYVDQFGVTYKPFVQNDSKYYKSTFGGILTIIIYGLAFSYLIFEMERWINGQVLPRVQQLSVFDNNLDGSVEFSPFVLSIQYVGGDEQLLKDKKLFEVELTQYTDAGGEYPYDRIETQTCDNKLPDIIYQICLKNDSGYRLWVDYHDSYQDQNSLLVTVYRCDVQGTQIYNLIQLMLIFKIKTVLMIANLNILCPKANCGQLWFCKKNNLTLKLKKVKYFRKYNIYHLITRYIKVIT